MPESYRRIFPTRWNDNDVYGHVNNTTHYAAMDTTITSWLITEAGLDPLSDDAMAVVVASSCEYRESFSFPDAVEVELQVARVGTTSVTWALTLRRTSDSVIVATGTFVHVFVDRSSARPAPIPQRLRSLIEEALPVAS